MATRQDKEIAKMGWDAFEEKLWQSATRGTKRSGREEQAFREHFGAEEYEALQKLVAHARLVRSRAPVLGNAIFLPGIMGSYLTTGEEDGDEVENLHQCSS